MSPSRRQFIQLGVLSTVTALAGCSSDNLTTDTPTITNTKSPTRTPTTNKSPTRTDEIEVKIHNATSSEVKPHLTIFGDGSVISEKDSIVPAESVVSVESGIKEAGQYELKVRLTDGRENSWQFTIENYDIRMGSDLIVAVKADEITLMIEE